MRPISWRALSGCIASRSARSTSWMWRLSRMSMKSTTIRPPMSRRRSWRATSAAASRLVRKAVSSGFGPRTEPPEFTSIAVSASVPSMTMLPPDAQRDAALEDRLDLRLDVEGGEDRLLAAVAAQHLLLARHDVVQELARALVDVLVVDVDLVDVGGEEVADGAQHDVVLAVDQRRRALVARRLEHALPQALQIGEIARQLGRCPRRARRRCARSGRSPRAGCSSDDQLAQALALLALDAARDAGRVVGAGQQHQVAAGQRVERGQRRRLVGELLLGDLDQDLLAGLEQVADAAAALAVARRSAAAAAWAGCESRSRRAAGTRRARRRCRRRRPPAPGGCGGRCPCRCCL